MHSSEFRKVAMTGMLMALLTSCSRTPSSPAAKVAAQPAVQPSAGSQTMNTSTATGHVKLRLLPAISEDVDSFPRVVPNENVSSLMAATLNSKFDRLDSDTRKALHECRAAERKMHPDQGDSVYEHKLSISMRGPRYLSVLTVDAYDCGGAHPENNDEALVYDVTTGAAIDWLTMLPGSRVGYKAEDASYSSSGIWPPLQQLALEQADDDCKDVYREKDLSFILWPDADQGAIVAEATGLSHISSALCGEQVVLDIPAAQRLGISPALLSLLATAHAATQTPAAKNH
jgi:hypothetical protein